MTKESIIACICESTEQDISLLPDFDDLILGVVEINGNIRTIYDREGIIRREMEMNGLSRVEAADWVDELQDMMRGKNMPLLLDNLENGFGR